MSNSNEYYKLAEPTLKGIPSEVYNRIHTAYSHSNPIQKDPRIEQQRIKKTSTLDLINSSQQEIRIPRNPQVPAIPSHIPQTIQRMNSNPQVPAIPSQIPIMSQPPLSQLEARQTQSALSPQQIQITQEIIRQAVGEIGKQSPQLLQALLKDITIKAEKYISPLLKDPKEEQKKIFKTSISEVVNPAEILHNKIKEYAEDFKENLRILGTRLTEQIKIPTTYKYIDIDSTYRNRNLYPNPCNFVIPFTDAAPKNSGLIAEDPVFLGFPWVMGTVNTISTSSSTTSILSNFTPSPVPSNYDGNLGLNPATLIPNFYDGYYIQVFTNPGPSPGLASEFSKILSNTSKEEFIVSPPISGPGLAVNRRYRIRKDVPILSNFLPAGSTINTIILSADANQEDSFYDGSLIIFYDPTNYISIIGYKIITNYDGPTKTATLASNLSSAPAAGIPFEIVKFSYDNLNPLRNTGTKNFNQPVCLDILLLHLIVPFSPYRNPSTGLTKLNITTGNGGSLRNYPYLYVHFYNDNSHSQTTMYGNNPHADIVTFKVTLDNPIFPPIQGAEFALQGQFVIFNNINVSAPQSIKLSTLESLRFRVTLPNGEDVIYDLPDNYSPLPPNPRVQFSAMIGINRK